MPKRASLKGRGADIFFGGDALLPEEQPGQDTEQPQETAPALRPEKEDAARDVPGDKTTRNLENKISRKLEERTPPYGFDINERADLKVGYLFTPDEFDAVMDVKLALSRQHGLKVTKNDIVRCAVHQLVDDYFENGEGSTVVRRLRAKKG